MMVDLDYVKQLEERLAYYENMIVKKAGIEDCLVPNGRIDVLKDILGYQPFTQDAGLVYGLRNTNNNLTIQTVSYTKSDSIRYAKDYVACKIARHCERVSIKSDQDMIFDLLRCSNMIFAKTQRGLGNVIWCSPSIYDKMRGRNEVMNKFLILKDDSFLFDFAIMGYKGSKENDCGLIQVDWADGSILIGEINGWEDYYLVLEF